MADLAFFLGQQFAKSKLEHFSPSSGAVWSSVNRDVRHIAGSDSICMPSQKSLSTAPRSKFHGLVYVKCYLHCTLRVFVV